MQQVEVQDIKGDLQQIEEAKCGKDGQDDEDKKKKKFKLPNIEVPENVKIFLLAFLKQVYKNQRQFQSFFTV